MGNQRKILFITKHPVHESLPMAGNQLFNHTLKSFCSDERFDIGWIYAGKMNEDFVKMKESFENISHDFSVAIPKFFTLFTGIYYRTFWRNIFALVNPSYYLLDPIYRHFYKKGIYKVKKSNWQPEWIVLEWTEVLFLLPLCKKLFPDAKIAVTEHDVTFVKLQRKFAKDAFLSKSLVAPFKQLEIALLGKTNLCSVLSQDDKNTLIENGINSEKIQLVVPFYHRVNKERKENILPQIVFYGALNRFENKEAIKWFIDKVYLPFHLSEKVKLIVIGGGGKELKEKIGAVEGVEFAGFVKAPEMIFAESLGMVVPLINGGGIKIKVLEALTCSLPVLTNSIGIEGIPVEDKVSYLHCETPEDYKNAILYLLENSQSGITIGNNGRIFVERHFNYELSLEAYKTKLLNN